MLRAALPGPQLLPQLLSLQEHPGCRLQPVPAGPCLHMGKTVLLVGAPSSTMRQIGEHLTDSVHSAGQSQPVLLQGAKHQNLGNGRSTAAACSRAGAARVLQPQPPAGEHLTDATRSAGQSHTVLQGPRNRTLACALHCCSRQLCRRSARAAAAATRSAASRSRRSRPALSLRQAAKARRRMRPRICCT